jgi:hypothetical protein
VGTIYGDWLQKIIDDALRLRNSTADDQEKGEFVYINEELFEDMKHINFLSSKAISLITVIRETWQRSVPTAKEGAWQKNVQREKNIRHFLEAA